MLYVVRYSKINGISLPVKHWFSQYDSWMERTGTIITNYNSSSWAIQVFTGGYIETNIDISVLCTGNTGKSAFSWSYHRPCRQSTEEEDFLLLPKGAFSILFLRLTPLFWKCTVATAQKCACYRLTGCTYAITINSQHSTVFTYNT